MKSPLDHVLATRALLKSKKSTREQCDAELAQAEKLLVERFEFAQSKPKGRATKDECEAFAVSAGLTKEDGDWFWNKAQGCGWKNNGKPIIDWQCTMRAWKLAHVFPSQKLGAQPAKERTRFQIGKDVEAIRTRISEIKSKNGQSEGPLGWTGPKLARGGAGDRQEAPRRHCGAQRTIRQGTNMTTQKTTVIHHSADFLTAFSAVRLPRKFLPGAELIGWNVPRRPAD